MRVTTRKEGGVLIDLSDSREAERRPVHRKGGASVILRGLPTQAPTMNALPSGGTATSPSSRRNGCLKSRRTNRSSSRCCATLCATGVWPTSLAKLNYVFGLAGIFAAIQAAKLTSPVESTGSSFPTIGEIFFRRLAVISIWILYLSRKAAGKKSGKWV